MNKYKVLIVASHPTPYSVSFWRLMAVNPELDLLVAYLSLEGVEKTINQDFGVEIAWDVPLLDGYSWRHIPNISPKPRLGKFWGLINPQLWQLIVNNNFDAVICYAGYNYATFWLLLMACKISKTPFIFTTDASSINPRSGSWKLKLKKTILPYLFNFADAILVSSTPGKQMVESIGIAEHKVIITPSVVDNDWWQKEVNKVNPLEIKQKWGIPLDAFVILYVAKLQPWKRPQDLLQAFAKLTDQNIYLVYAGNGALFDDLQREAIDLGVANRVIFLGFVNQSQLPSVYAASDVFVLPSEYEPFGVVVNEAMICGCVVITSDRVGAHYDLIRSDENGYIYPCGQIDDLVSLLNKLIGDHAVAAKADRQLLAKLKRNGQKRMETWSPRDNVEGVIKAIKIVNSEK